MKKSVNTTNYSNYSQETATDFFTFLPHFLVQKNDFTALCSQIIFLFQEKLPIVYANIRV